MDVAKFTLFLAQSQLLISVCADFRNVRSLSLLKAKTKIVLAGVARLVGRHAMH